MEQVQSELRTMQGNFSEVPAGLGAMAIMGRDGDTKHMWDRNSEAEVAAARALFNTLVNEKKYVAFRVEESGDKGEGPIREFNPNEERYIFSPALVGG